ncbi:hypothetical protein [Rhizobium chutanense]|uniref:PA14 domain-containing protein n=1 Tax=Rhizobium chutanense TaxID=2035448 RepID=A0A3S0QL79_9HYPH|nr:hypothetical protein [Rhizobium chutanense]RUM06397.1 hypothetical protein EFR84_12265 [Rhizobium chutanense]
MNYSKTTTTLAALALSATAALAQSSDLDGRVDALERKMDTILKLLQDREPNAESKPQQTSAGLQPDGFVPGLYMDVYPPLNKGIYEANGARDIPTGIPAASVAISPSSTLSYGEILNHDETRDFTTTGNETLPAVVFRGYLQIEERGRHAVGFNFKMNANSCVVKLQLNGKSVVDVYDTNKSFYSNIPALDLAPGLYKMDLYLECRSTDRQFPFGDQNVTMMLATPDDRAPKPAPSSVFYIKQ